MVSSGLLRRVALVRTDVSEEPGASFIRVTKIGELGTTRRNNPEDKILHSHRRENLKSYRGSTVYENGSKRKRHEGVKWVHLDQNMAQRPALSYQVENAVVASCVRTYSKHREPRPHRPILSNALTSICFWFESPGSGYGSAESSYEQDNKASGCIKVRKFLSR
jgi:hypothetical protein